MTESSKPGLLIFYDYFYPAYKAGGPIQSLTNLILALHDVFEIAVITGSHDLNDSITLNNIETDRWFKQKLPKSGIILNTWYASPGKPNAAIIKKAIAELKPSLVYLNGIFSYRFVILPLLSIKNLKIIICPRGMLQKGALAGKPFKKKMYLSILRLSGLVRKVTWHATNEEEEDDIKKIFGPNSKIMVAGNIPKKPLAQISYPVKEPGQLHLIYLSLISEKKNLLQLINILQALKGNVSLDIYGPVKDETYWKKCQEAIKSVNAKVVYKGDVLPEAVQEIFMQYHVSILLTKGENFGHALYESFSSGRPVITSHFTPWKELSDRKAGWNIEITNEEQIEILINQVCSMNQSSYNEYCDGAYMLANEYYNTGFDIVTYKRMFSS